MRRDAVAERIPPPPELFHPGEPGLREDHDCLTLRTRMLPPRSGMRTCLPPGTSRLTPTTAAAYAAASSACAVVTEDDAERVTDGVSEDPEARLAFTRGTGGA